MNGPQHVAEARDLLARSKPLATGDPDDQRLAQIMATQALAHAQLAQVDATIDAVRWETSRWSGVFVGEGSPGAQG